MSAQRVRALFTGKDPKLCHYWRKNLYYRRYLSFTRWRTCRMNSWTIIYDGSVSYVHQTLSMEIAGTIRDYIRRNKGSCQVLSARWLWIWMQMIKHMWSRISVWSVTEIKFRIRGFRVPQTLLWRLYRHPAARWTILQKCDICRCWGSWILDCRSSEEKNDGILLWRRCGTYDRAIWSACNSGDLWWPSDYNFHATAGFWSLMIWHCSGCHKNMQLMILSYILTG